MGNNKKRTKPSEERIKESKGADAKSVLSLAEVFQTLISNGHNINDIKHEYTMAQVYLYYEKCKKIELDQRFYTAIIGGQASLLGTPAYDRAGLKSKQDQWKKFIDSLSWDKITKKSEVKDKVKSNSAGLSSLMNMGTIPVVGGAKIKKSD